MQSEAEWAQALDDAEQAISHVLSTVPKDQVLDYVKDLRMWSNRVYDEQITKAFRILNALGYSKSQCATTLGMSPQTLNRILTANRGPVPLGRNPRTDLLPEDPIDVRDEFQRLSDLDDRGTRWRMVADTAQENPHRWVWVTDKGHSVWAWHVRTGHLSAFRPAGTFDAITRKGNGVVGRIYVMYVGG